jgi:signal transduction histidine kinase
MTTPWNLTIFDMLPAEKLQTGARGPFAGVVVLGNTPRAFILGTLLTVDSVSLIWGLLTVLTLRAFPLPTIICSAALFLVDLVLLLFARSAMSFPAALAYYAAAFVLSILLNILFPGNWGDFGLLALCGFVLYRFPLRWSSPIAALSIVGLAENHGFNNVLLTRHVGSNSQLVTLLAIAAFLCWVGWSRRMQHRQVVRLQEMQKRLREQMERAKELAATRERVRIARDMHDVLAHSLTVLSIQVQAARQLVHQHPDLLPKKLEDMASLLRESIAESRRVVGLLRGTAVTTSMSHGVISMRLQAVVDRFGERTGIHCAFEEEGMPQRISDKQGETLQYALQEALTNAHRHGAAAHIWAKLQWQEAQVTLHVRDDGKSQDAFQPQDTTGPGHHGLQGMHERATALGGKLQAEREREGGFAVALSLPFEKAERTPLQEGER